MTIKIWLKLELGTSQSFNGRSVRMRYETFPASSLVFIACPDLHSLLGFDRSLGIISRTAAFYTDGMRLGNEFGDRQELRHRLKRLSTIVLVQTRDYHSF